MYMGVQLRSKDTGKQQALSRAKGEGTRKKRKWVNGVGYPAARCMARQVWGSECKRIPGKLPWTPRSS
jgi:hypothetical protein